MRRRLYSGRALGAVCEALVANRPDWAQHAVDTFSAFSAVSSGAAMQFVEHDELVLRRVSMVGSGCARGLQLSVDHVQGSGLFGLLYLAPRTYVSVADVLDRATEQGRQQFRAYGLADIAGLSVACDRRRGVGMCWCLEELYTPSEHERRLIARLALHLELSLRSRLIGELAGTVSLDGAPLEFAGHRAQLWRALRCGSASLLAAGHHEARHYRVVANPHRVRLARALTDDEVTVLEASAAGEPGKQLAWRLGVAPTTVSRLLASGTYKLGLANPLDAVRVVAGLTRRAPEVDTERLSPAEEAVLGHLRAGLSNRQIAEARGTSDRTVANQVAALLRKTGQPSRRALAAARLV